MFLKIKIRESVAKTFKYFRGKKYSVFPSHQTIFIEFIFKFASIQY